MVAAAVYSVVEVDVLSFLQVREAEEGMMLWKRVRHCVVFGGTLVKAKPANS